ncbi:MAG: BACON domain-containing carbohydrate-binding protein [Candidatus Solibacter sp.]
MRLLIALAFAAPLFSQTCKYVVTPTVFNIGADTTPGTVQVSQTFDSNCGPYLATTSVPWLHIDPNTGGGLPGSSVNFIADANLGASPRSGVMQIALQNVTVNQGGANCSFSVSPTSQSFPVGGGDATFLVQSGCGWLATSNVPWLTLKANSTSGIPVPYSVASNVCVSARTGTITVQTGLTTPPPPTVAVTQEGSAANLVLSATSATVGAAASNGRITVTTGDPCNWSAVSDVNWIQITIGSTGTGNGGISYRILANTAAERFGSIRVGALKYTITQLASGSPAPIVRGVVSAANYNADAVAPGEIVALFGDNMGPASIVTLQLENGTVTSSLAGTQVLFDDVPAPMVYTLKGQVSAVVPYGVAGKPSTAIQVKYLDQVSNTMTVTVRAAHPGVFTLDSSGVGPGAILNQDLTVNTSGNRAAPLSVIAIYCTGGGVTDPASLDGEVIGGPLRRLTQIPVVTIGGLNAVVKFAGAAPDSIAGLVQINAEVPAGLAPTVGAPVIVKIGDWSSTANVTVSVK